MNSLKIRCIVPLLFAVMALAVVVDINFKEISFWVYLYFISFSIVQTINYFKGNDIGLPGFGIAKRNDDYAVRFMGFFGAVIVGLLCLYSLVEMFLEKI